MNTVRLNITLPRETAEKLKGIRSKSSFIAESIEEYIKKQERERLKAELREGYKTTRKEDAVITHDWETTAGDGVD